MTLKVPGAKRMGESRPSNPDNQKELLWEGLLNSKKKAGKKGKRGRGDGRDDKKERRSGSTLQRIPYEEKKISRGGNHSKSKSVKPEKNKPKIQKKGLQKNPGTPREGGGSQKRGNDVRGALERRSGKGRSHLRCACVTAGTRK